LKTRGLAAAGAAAVLALGVAGAGGASLEVPRALQAAAVAELPAFAWGATGADHYEFEVAADRGFRSTIFHTTTWNTRATMTKAVPNGTYWWHVRSVSKGGGVSGWSAPRSVRKAWSSAPRLLSPVGGVRVSFPAQPLTLSWSAVPRAAKYLVEIATDASLSSLVGDKAIETAATSLTPGLTPGSKSKTYYWAVTPLDAQGNKGLRSRPQSFNWLWPSQTKVHADDLRSEQETVDPQFSWAPVPGAAEYEIEVNSSHPPDWAPSSRVCCKKTVVGTTFSSTQIFADNTYYWRVRAIDVNGNAGVWNYPDESHSSLLKVFDKQLGRASISDLRMIGDSSRTPVVGWSPVPGASEYLVDVVPYGSVAGTNVCDWGEPSGQHAFHETTPSTYWTPIAQPRGNDPYPTSARARRHSTLVPGSYCVRVRADSDKDTEGDLVYGDYTYINGPDSPAFTYSPPCPSSCGVARHVGGGDLGSPGQGVLTPRNPLLTWRPSAGATWWVLVAKDPEFHTVVDYAFTNVPAYAPRVTLPDEATHYYWTVLPSPLASGEAASGDPVGGAAQMFDKRSVPPSLIVPKNGTSVPLAPRFQWSPVEGARTYHFEVSQDKDFGKLLDDVETDSVAYTSNTSYPADIALYWRVRAETADKVELGWSSTRTFKYHLRSPAARTAPSKADFIPTFRWSSVTGAVSYDFHIDYPNGRTTDVKDIPSTAITAVKFTGPGVWHWRVRANFPTSRNDMHGAWSKLVRFTKAIPTPSGLTTSVGGGSLVLSWQPRLGAASYRVEISPTPDFEHASGTTTDLTSYAPDRSLSSRGGGGTFYWRVAAEDEDGNQGAFSTPRRFRAPGASTRR
jgi:hypothetical protein